MKVQNINVPDQGLPRARGAETHGAAGDKPLVFQKTLTSLSAEQYRTQLASLVSAIDEQSKRLSKRADIAEFEKYRQLIRKFLDEVVSNSYSFSKEDAFGARGRHRFFATVKTIDDKLDELAKEVLSGQADSIKVLEKMGEIRGLILDMMM